MSNECPPDAALIVPEIEGWEFKYIGDEPRLSEQVDLFREIGFEVRIEPFNADECRGCTECFEDSPEQFMLLYVRKMS